MLDPEFKKRDDAKDKRIIRQSCLKMAIELLNSEQERAKSEASIPIASLKALTIELEKFVNGANLPEGKAGRSLL